MGVIYKSENVSTLPPLTRSPSPDRGGFRADIIRPYDFAPIQHGGCHIDGGAKAPPYRRGCKAVKPHPSPNGDTVLLRCPKISAAYALKFLTAAPSLARCFVHWTRFASLAPKRKALRAPNFAPTVSVQFKTPRTVYGPPNRYPQNFISRKEKTYERSS